MTSETTPDTVIASALERIVDGTIGVLIQSFPTQLCPFVVTFQEGSTIHLMTNMTDGDCVIFLQQALSHHLERVEGTLQ